MKGWSRQTGPDLETVVDRLSTADLEVVGRLPWSSNMTFLVSVKLDPDDRPDRPDGDDPPDRPDGDDPPDQLLAVYKPERGERSLWDFPDGLFRREVAAYELSEALGWNIVPPTVLRHDGPFGTGSVQLFVDVDYARHYFTLLEDGTFDAMLRTVCAFDVVVNNADRKSGHVLWSDDSRLWAIDHGLCFHAQPKLRTVIWDFAGDAVARGVLADLSRLGDGVPDALGRLLSGSEQRALLNRIESFVACGRFPDPIGGDRPPYPWPLV